MRKGEGQKEGGTENNTFYNGKLFLRLEISFFFLFFSFVFFSFLFFFLSLYFAL